MKTKRVPILTLLLIAALFSGCASTRYGASESTVAGWVTVENNTYSKTGPLTIGVETSELVPRKNTSGGRVRFLWGLFTIADD